MKEHAFGVATQVGKKWVNQPYDGIFGLARSRTATVTHSKQFTRTPFEALLNRGLIDEGIVSFKIPRPGGDGQITFG
jgi:hypothetical protein